MPSRRLDWGRPPNRLSREVAARRALGLEVLDLTVSNPAEAGVAPDAAALREATASLDLAGYRPDPRGDLDARTAIAGTWAARGATVAPEHLVLTASTSEAYSFLFKFLCDPGDVVLVPAPSYPLFDFLAALEGVRTRPYPLRYDGAWHVDLDAFDRAAAAARLRAVLAVHPNNPTGSFLRRSEVERMVGACARAGAALVSDEVFAEFVLREEPGRAGSLAAETRVPTFALGGLSKSVALPQMKLGWIAVAGPPGDRDAACAGLDLVADTYLSVSAVAQRAAPALLGLGPATRERVLARLRRNLDAVRRRCDGSAVTVLDVEGGWSVVVRVPAVRSAEAWAVALVRERGVVVQPGYFYDFAAEAHLVLGLLTPPERFDRGVEALVELAGRGPDVASPA